MSEPLPSPIAPSERVITVDVLRGFALFGVLLANLFWLYSLRQFNETPDPRAIDRGVDDALEIFLHSNAQTLFMCLFGFGFAVQLLRADARGQRIVPVYARRMAALFVLGWLHITLLWWGDVTWNYAVLGLALLPFLRASNRTRLITAAVLLVVPEIILRVVPSLQAPARERLHHAVPGFLEAVHGPSYRALMVVHPRFAIAYLRFPLWYWSWILAHFLIGFVAGVQKWFEDNGARHLPLFRKLVVFGAIAAIPRVALHVFHMLHEPTKPGPIVSTAEDTLWEIGTLGMTSAYVGTIVLLMQRPWWRRWLALIAPAGRMPLTTYYSQSLICTSLCYGWGLGLAGHLTATQCVAMACVIFPLQLLVAHLWLSRMRYGPLEWVWRKLVYGRLPFTR